MAKAIPRPTFFATPAAFRCWLEQHHATATELWVGFHRKSSGRPSITWSEAVDEALCFGWIDGIRKKVDEGSYTNRFTPRKHDSTWSAVNTRRVKALKTEGKMHPAGLAAFKKRDPKKSGYSFEQRKGLELDPALQARFKKNAAAWRFFEAQPPGYRRTMIFYVMSAKQDDTRLRRLERLIADSAAGRRLL